MICVGLVVVYCFVAKEGPISDYCQLYDRIIVEQGDSKITAPLGVKKRLLANELKFKQLCGGGNGK